MSDARGECLSDFVFLFVFDSPLGFSVSATFAACRRHGREDEPGQFPGDSAGLLHRSGAVSELWRGKLYVASARRQTVGLAYFYTELLASSLLGVVGLNSSISRSCWPELSD